MALEVSKQEMGLALSVLGPIKVSLNGIRLKYPTVRTHGLLIFLAVESALGSPAQRREVLTDLLWPAMPTKSGRKNLRQTIYYLRKTVGEVEDRAYGNDKKVALLHTDRQTVQINPEYPLRLDLAYFLRETEGTLPNWSKAISFYSDDFLVDFHIDGARTFEDWAAARRAVFHRNMMKGLHLMAAEAIKKGNFTLAEEYAR